MPKSVNQKLAQKLRNKTRIPVFKTGFYPHHLPTPNGEATTDLLRQIADSYDALFYAAPISVEHETRAEAKGRLATLQVEGDTLFATFDPVTAEFAQAIDDGKYLYPSLEIYFPANSANPTPGKFSAKAVSFLGTSGPGVKGLFAGFSAPWEYQDEGGLVACFNDLNRQENSSDMTELEKLQAKFDKAEADAKAAKEASDKEVAEFAEKEKKSAEKNKQQSKKLDKLQEKIDDLDDDKTAEFKELEKSNKELEKRLDLQEKSEKTRDKTRRTEQLASFSEEMKSDGWYTPAVVDDKITPRLENLLDDAATFSEVMAGYREGSEKGAIDLGGEHSTDPSRSKGSDKLTSRQRKNVALFSEEGRNKDGDAYTGDSQDGLDVCTAGYAAFNEKTVPGESREDAYKRLRESMTSAAAQKAVA